MALGLGGWVAWTAWSAAARDRLPAGIVSANGRIEAASVDVATEVPGRVTEIAVREGDRVARDQTVARLDAATAEAAVNRAEAEAERARQAVAVAEAARAAQEADLTFARQEFDRTAALADADVASHRAHQQAQCLAAVRAFPGCTSYELAVKTSFDRYKLARRTSEVERAGGIRRGEKRVCTISGEKAITWWPV
ncbi:MAG: biotin/lipoyl-binding protein [Pseudomonadota bacterium]